MTLDEWLQRRCETVHALAEENIGYIQVLLEEFLKEYYPKECHLDFRVKSADKMMRKINIRRKNGHRRDPQDLPDTIGFRMAVDSNEDVLELDHLIEEHLHPIRKVDYMNQPKPSGFQATLYYFQFNHINYEVQVMTKTMEKWTNETHDEYDQRTYGV